MDRVNGRVSTLAAEVNLSFEKLFGMVRAEIQKVLQNQPARTDVYTNVNKPVPGGNQAGLAGVVTPTHARGAPHAVQAHPTQNLPLSKVGLESKFGVRGIDLHGTASKIPQFLQVEKPVEISARTEREGTVPVSSCPARAAAEMGEKATSSSMLTPLYVPPADQIPEIVADKNHCTIAGIGFAGSTTPIRASGVTPVPIGFAANPIQAHMANRAKQLQFSGLPGDYKTFCEHFELFWESLGGTMTADDRQKLHVFKNCLDTTNSKICASRMISIETDFTYTKYKRELDTKYSL